MGKFGDDFSKEKEQEADVFIHATALSNLLIEKYEYMIEKGYIVQSTKSSVKTALHHLNRYVDGIFKKSDNKEDLIFAADIVLAVQNKLVHALNDKEINILSDRKQLLRTILQNKRLDIKLVASIMEEVEQVGILKI